MSRIDQPGSPETQRERRWSYDRLKELILQACSPEQFREGLVAYDALPDEIDAGKLAQKAVECGLATRSDGKERGTVSRFNPATRRIEIQSSLVVGTEEQIILRFRNDETRDEAAFLQAAPESIIDPRAAYRDAQEQLRRSGDARSFSQQMRENTAAGRTVRSVFSRWVGTTHSHPDSSPFSEVDLLAFLTGDGRLFETLGGVDETVQALVATTDTVWIPRSEFAAKRAAWEKMVEDRMDEVTRVPVHQLRDQDRVFKEVQRSFIRSLAQKYKFGYYVAEPGGLLKRVTSSRGTV